MESRGRSPAAGMLIGIFERGANLQNRLEAIMNYEPKKRQFGWVSRVALATIAILLLPMGRSLISMPPAVAQEGPNSKIVTNDTKTDYPQIVETSPARGATDVDPNCKEIRVTFDRDMGKGMSWTGGAPLFPASDKSRKPRWVDARTCVLPVKLAAGSYYRVGINSTSFRNFQSRDSVAAPPSVIYFATKGASEEVASRVQVPEIVSLDPANGATDVDPATQTLRVTFNMPMGKGMSWTGSGPKFPKDRGKASWSSDGRTCTLPVSLEAAHAYRLGLNSQIHINFQSEWGVPLRPVVYTLTTRGSGH